MTQLSLPDGRALEFRVSGPQEGGADDPVLVFHHGTPGSAAPIRALEQAAHDRGMQVATFSRPGYGGSTRRAGRTVADLAGDVAALLDHLHVDRCVTLGWSGGGPHALALGALLPDRVAGVSLIASVAPYDSPGLDFLSGMGEQNLDEFGRAAEGEAALRPFLEEEAAGLRTAEAADIGASLDSLLPDVDRACMTDEFGEDLARNFHQGLAPGVDGWLDDDLAFVAPWGFDLDAVSTPVFLWQGDLDLMVPFAHGRWLADHVPGAVPHLEAGEGHVSVTVGKAEPIVAELAGCLA
jgi:pimeloyl-ACP methyl ester carboxylesterase